MEPNQDILNTFTEDTMPDLDVAVLGALEMISDTELPKLALPEIGRPLVIGSVNAYAVGTLLFTDTHAFFGDESSYQHVLAQNREHITSAVLISASGGKHSVGIAKHLKEQGITTWLFTNTVDAPAFMCVGAEHTLLFPKNREPYTYNVSTYLSMLCAKTGEDASAILDFITKEVAGRVPKDFHTNDAYYLIIPSRFIGMRSMFQTKFDELFGPLVSARVFTLEESKHAKTVVPSDTERFISFGEENVLFGAEENRLHIPLPDGAGYAAMMAIGYYVIGHIQKQHPPYFKDNIDAYARRASELFNQKISPIVE